MIITLVGLAYLGSSPWVWPTPLGIALFPFRVFLPVVLVTFLLIRRWGQEPTDRLVGRTYKFLIFWAIYGAVLIAFAHEPGSSAHYWLFLVTYIVFTYLICEMIDGRWGLNAYMKGCVFILCVFLLMATWEHATGRHMPRSAFDVATTTPGTVARMLYSTQEAHQALLYIPTGTSGNPNDFAYGLVLLVPFALGWMLLTRHMLIKIAMVGVCLWSTFVIAVTQSRASLLALVFFVAPLFFLVAVGTRRTRAWIIAIVLLGGLCALGAVVLYPGAADAVAVRFEDAMGTTDIDYLKTSVRWPLTVNAAYFMVQRAGLGVGARQCVDKMIDGQGLMETGETSSVHNMWAEILGDFGLPIFIPLLILFVYMMIRLVRISRRAGDLTASVHAAVSISMFAGMIPSALSPSGGIYLVPTFATAGYVMAVIRNLGTEEPDPVGEWSPQDDAEDLCEAVPEPA